MLKHNLRSEGVVLARRAGENNLGASNPGNTRFSSNARRRGAEETASGNLEKGTARKRAYTFDFFESRPRIGGEQCSRPGKSTFFAPRKRLEYHARQRPNLPQVGLSHDVTARDETSTSFRNRLGAVNKRRIRSDRSGKRRISFPEKRLRHFDAAAERLLEAPKLPKWHAARRGRFS